MICAVTVVLKQDEVSGGGEQDQCLPPTVAMYNTSNNEENGGRPMNNWGICEDFIIDGPGKDSRVGSGDGPVWGLGLELRMG